MRHGRPTIDFNAIKNHKKSSLMVGQIIDDYEFVDLQTDQIVPESSQKIAQSCQALLCSDMYRAISSTKRLGLNLTAAQDACFRETPMPYLNWQKPQLKFYTWCVLFRIIWYFFGFKQNGESLKLAQMRAQMSAEKLVQTAQQNPNIMLLGHGIMNRLIGRKLIKMGWQQLKKSDDGYWSYVVFEKT